MLFYCSYKNYMAKKTLKEFEIEYLDLKPPLARA